MIRSILIAALLALSATSAAAQISVKPTNEEPYRPVAVEFSNGHAVNTVSGIINACVSMTVFWERASTAAVSLYGVSQTDETFAQVEAGTLLAQLSSTTKVSISPQQSYLRFVVDTAETANYPSRARIVCSDIAGGGDPVNVAIDTDGDGAPDFIEARGGSASTLEDLQRAIDQLTDTGEKRVLVSGTWDSSAMSASADFTWDSTRLIELGANTVMQCEPTARLYGPGLAFWRDRTNAVYLIGNSDGADNVIVRDCFVENTDLLSGFDQNTSGTGWGTTSLFGGIVFVGCDGCVAEGNTVRGSPHSGYFMTRSQNSTFRGNVAYGTGEAFGHEGTSTTLAATEPAGETSLDLTASLANCAEDEMIFVELDADDPLRKAGTTRNLYAAGWVEATGDPITIRRAAYASGRNPGLPSQASAGNEVFCTEGDKHGIETFTEDDDPLTVNGTPIVATDNSMEFNAVSFVPGVAFQIRGASATEDECDDDVSILCWHEGTMILGNQASDVGGALVQIRGARNTLATGNRGVRTGGVEFVKAIQACSEVYDDDLGDIDPGDTVGAPNGQYECTQDTTLSDNVVTDCAPTNLTAGGCGRFNGGHERIVWTDTNLIDGTIAGNAYAIGGDLVGSKLDLRARNIAGSCLVDATVVANGDPITSPVYGSGIFDWAGLADVSTGTPCVSWRMEHTAGLTLDPLVVNGVNGSAVYIDPGGSHDIVAPTLRNVDLTGHGAGYSGTYATELEADAAVRCDAAAEGLWVITENAQNATDCNFSGGIGGQSNRCRCDGSGWANWDPSAASNVVQWNISDTSTGGGIFGGTITNGLTNNTRLLRTGSGSGVVQDFSIVDVVFQKGAEGMLSTDGLRGIDEHNATFNRLTVDGVQFIGLTDDYLGHPSGDFSGFSGSSRIYDVDDLCIDRSPSDGFCDFDGTTPYVACQTGAFYQETDETVSPGAIRTCVNGNWVDLD